jgi:PadR family transcriptional regulator AphA
MLDYAEPGEGVPFEADSLVSTCIEGGAGALLLDAPIVPAPFFDLRTRLAGELLHGLSKYRLRLAVVVPDLTVHSQIFQDFAHESNQGHQTRFFASRGEAVAWLESLN